MQISTCCPMTECPKCKDCSRHSFYLKAIAEDESLTIINPSKLHYGPNGCEHRLVPVQVRLAYGFTRLDSSLPKCNANRLRSAIHFGSDSTYFRTRRGERSLSPQEQRAILDCVEALGGNPDLGFDRYSDTTIYVHPKDDEG